MSNITIPTIGSQFTLTADWTFRLFCEGRNDKLLDYLLADKLPPEALGHYGTINYREAVKHLTEIKSETQRDSRGREWEAKFHIDYTLPKGTILKVDRIYLRKGISDYDSLTFFIQSHPTDKRIGKKRFWAKLEDVNAIQGEWDMTTVPVRK